MTQPTLTAQRPYFLRAMHEWLTDNGHTPHLIVDVTVADVHVPMAYAKDGKIVLNLSHSACHALSMGNDWVEFQARFAGIPHGVRVPLRAVLGIYSQETGQGMAFNEKDLPPPPSAPEPTPAPTESEQRRARFKVVK